MVSLDPTQIGSRPSDYGCRNCDDSTYSYVTGIYYSSQTARDHAEQAIVLAKQHKIDMAKDIAILEKLSAEIDKRNEDFENEMILKVELENQRKQNEIKRIENQGLQELEKVKLTPKPIPELKPEIVVPSILIPLAAIGLLLYTTRSKK